MCVTTWPFQVAPQNKRGGSPAWQLEDGNKGLPVYTLSSPFPASSGAVQTQRFLDSVWVFCQARVHGPLNFSSSQRVVDQEATDGVVIRKRVESFHPKGALPSLRLPPLPSLVLLQGSLLSCLAWPLASLAPAPQHHQCLHAAPCDPMHRTSGGHRTCSLPLCGHGFHWSSSCLQVGPHQGPVFAWLCTRG